MAAASIGQVYRARLADDDREVAVKVQYPGVASAVRADLQNMGLIMRVAKRIAPGMDAKAMAAEIRERLSDELDYEHEAQNHRAFARAWRGHPFIYVPDVVTSLSTEKVLVSEWVDGTGLRGGARDGRGHARPLRRDRVPLLLRLAVPQRALLRRPPPGQLPADARRPGGLPGLRHDQEAEPGAGGRRGQGGAADDGGRRRGPARPHGPHGLLRPRRRQGVARGRVRARPGHARLVRRRRGDHPRPRDRRADPDRLRRPPLAPLGA